MTKLRLDQGADFEHQFVDGMLKQAQSSVDKAVNSMSQRKPLTDEEISEYAERMEASDPTDSFWREFARAIEAAHGIKELV